MDLTKWKELANELLNKPKVALSALPPRLSSLADRILQSSLAVRLLGRFPEEKRRPMLYGIGGLVVFFFILIIALAANSGKPRATAVPDMISGPQIPPEQLFFPAEPDFLPEFLLEREPRSFWTIEDIRPYWRNPGNPDLWREEINSAVDRLMEGVR